MNQLSPKTIKTENILSYSEKRNNNGNKPIEGFSLRFLWFLDKGLISMSENKEAIELTAKEKAILYQSLAKFEKTARWWKCGRYYLMLLIVFLYVSGIYGIWPCVKIALHDIDKQEIIDRLSSEPVPENVTENNWIVGYVNKIFIISAFERKMQLLTLCFAIIGSISLTVALFGTVFLINHWKNGMRDLAITKVIQGYLEQLT